MRTRILLTIAACVLGVTGITIQPRTGQGTASRQSWKNMLTYGVAPLEAQTLPELSGIFTIRQQGTGRFLDAHDTADKDFGVVTRPFQANLTQQWEFIRVGNGIFKIQQQQTGRFLDAHDTQDKDFRVVMRPEQPNTTQHWIVTLVGNNTYVISQRSTGRFLDAHNTTAKDFAVVSRPWQNNPTQRWIINRAANVDTTSVPPPSAGTCAIVGRVEGNLRQVACVDPKCHDTQEFVLRQASVFTRMPHQLITSRPLDGREYSFSNLEAGKTYVVAPTGLGWSFDLLGAPVMCVSEQVHRLNFRLKGVSAEF